MYIITLMDLMFVQVVLPLIFKGSIHPNKKIKKVVDKLN